MGEDLLIFRSWNRACNRCIEFPLYFIHQAFDDWSMRSQEQKEEIIVEWDMVAFGTLMSFIFISLFSIFGRFFEAHEFEKPDDERALNSMNSCAGDHVRGIFRHSILIWIQWWVQVVKFVICYLFYPNLPNCICPSTHYNLIYCRWYELQFYFQEDDQVLPEACQVKSFGFRIRMYNSCLWKKTK